MKNWTVHHQSWVSEEVATSPPAPVSSSPPPAPVSPESSDAEVDVGDLFPEIDGDSSADPDWQLGADSSGSSPPSSPVLAPVALLPVCQTTDCSVTLNRLVIRAAPPPQVLQPLCLVLVLVTNLTCSG